MCCAPSDQAQAQANVQIELDAFSGRPNPRWTLPEPQGSAFMARLHALPPVPGAAAPDGLGYRGFIVRPEPNVEVRVYRGMVIVRRGDSSETFGDQDHALERLLLGSARGHVAEPVLQHIESELRR